METDKDIEKVTIAEYMKYKAETMRLSRWNDRYSSRPIGKNDRTDYEALNTPETQFEDGELSMNDDVDDWLGTEMEEYKQGQEDNEEDALIDVLKSLVDECKGVSLITNDDVLEGDSPSKFLPCQLPPKELNPGSFTLPCTIGSLNLYVMKDLGASINVMPKSMFEYLKLANLTEIEMQVEMANMTKKAPLGMVENILVKSNKFLFPSDFVIIYMLGEPSETMILEESFNLLEIGDDLFSYESPTCLLFEQYARFYDDESIDTFDSSDNMQEPIVEHKNIINLEKITSRWHVCKPVRVFYDNGCGKDYGMWPTCNPNLSFYSGYIEIYGKEEHGMLKQWMCFRDNEIQSVGGSSMLFDFLKVLDSFYIEANYGRTCDDPYSRRFDEYKRTFDNEIKRLANEYDLRIGKKGKKSDGRVVLKRQTMNHLLLILKYLKLKGSRSKEMEFKVSSAHIHEPVIPKKLRRIRALEQKTQDLDVEVRQASYE
ncbi:phospholipase-like protein [Tanacetum coccineum]